MKGVQFTTDQQGHRVAVVLDLKEWGEIWEDIYDAMVAMERAGEPAIRLEDFEADIRSP